MGLLDGKVALISGAARGQGRAHALRLAREGAAIIAFDICEDIRASPIPLATREDLNETVRLTEELGGKIYSAVADVRDFDGVMDVVTSGIECFGGIDVVVANAGILSHRGPTWTISEDSFLTVLDVNLIGVWHTIKAVVPTMLADQRPGSIVVIASGAAVKGLANIGPYVVSKHGLIGLTRTLARELGPSGIRVNAILPGNTNTAMLHNPGVYGAYAADLEEPTEDDFTERARLGSPMRVPYVEPMDVSEAVVWLASDHARFVTGVLLPVDGGTAIP